MIMTLSKCPRCELNYITDGEKYCKICRQEMKGEPVHEEIEMCTAMGIDPISGMDEIIPEAEPGEDEAMSLEALGEEEDEDDDLDDDDLDDGMGGKRRK